MKASVENKIVLGFAASVLALMGMGWLSYHTTTNLIATEKLVSHTHEVVATLESGLAILTDAETKQRGYLLTGNEQFLKDCQTAQTQVGVWLKQLRALTADNPDQQQRLDKLEPLISQRLAILNGRIKLRQEQGLQASAADVNALREGKELMDQIWSVVAEIRGAEDQLLAQRQQEANRNAQISLTIILIGSALSCAVGLLAIIWIHRDLRLRGQTETALRESRAQIQSILDNMPAIIFLKDLEGRYLFVNRQYQKIYGLSSEQAIGKTVFDVIPRERAEIAHAHHKKILATQSALELEETLTYSGGLHTHFVVKFPIRDTTGNIYATGGISTDITESKRAQEELDRFFALSLDFLCIASADGYFKRVSPAVTDILGWSVEEFLSRPFISFVHPDDHAATLHEVEKQVATGEKVLHFENRYQHKDGSWRVLSWRSIPHGGLMYATARDVTEQKRAEEKIILQKQELEATNKELEAFSYSVSHDLRAPLRHVDGFVDLLRKQSAETLDVRGRRYLDIIANSARDMGNLIDDLLVFSRMSRADLRRSKVAAESLVHEVVDALQGDINGRRIDWKLGTLPEVEADPAMLRQVWANLIGNAVKYTRPRDPAEIEIGCNAHNGEFVFHIRDNGVGFDMQYAHKLFGVFQRLHRAEDFEGTGIGLANVQRIIHRHGGRTWAEGKIDAGATFFFSLPRTQTETKG